MGKYYVDVNMYGDKLWYNEDGVLHREDGPAIIYFSGTRFFWLKGLWITEDKFLRIIE